MEPEQPVIFDNNYKSQIMEEAEVEAILLENLTKAKEPIPPLTQTPGMEEAEEVEEVEEAEEGEILEMLEEGEIPRILMQQE